MRHIPNKILMSGGEGMVCAQTRAGEIKVIKVTIHPQKQAEVHN